MYTIEHNVPVPASNMNGHGREKYPFSQMDVGDSFGIPKDAVARVRQAAYKRNTDGKKFVVQTLNENGGRCWRVK